MLSPAGGAGMAQDQECWAPTIGAALLLTLGAALLQWPGRPGADTTLSGAATGGVQARTKKHISAAQDEGIGPLESIRAFST